ncbi:MAG: amidohydrolase family protein [Rhizobiaceae bacterium]|nr:amidohydrolase family protein [Rhizobiaceae bacterium]
MNGSAHTQSFGHPLPPRLDWLDSQPVEPVLDPDIAIIDTHHHFWDRPGNRYFGEELESDLLTGHNVVGTVFVESQTAYYKNGPEWLRPVGETEFVAQLAATSDAANAGRFGIARGIVGFADLSLGGRVRSVLDAHIEAGRGRFCGIRYATAWDASDAIRNSHAASGPDTLLRPDVLDGLKTLADMNLAFDAMLFHPQLDQLAELARAIPTLTIIVGNTGGPLGYGPYEGKCEEVLAQWADSMRKLAQHPNIVVKLGGMLSRLAAFDYLGMPVPPTSEALAGHWAPYIDRCIDFFGAERCMFESNFPVEKMGTGYATLWNAFKRMAAGASEAEKRALFSGTAQQTYRLATPLR